MPLRSLFAQSESASCLRLLVSTPFGGRFKAGVRSWGRVCLNVAAVLGLGWMLAGTPAAAQTVVGTDTVGSNPYAVAVNPATNTIYVVNDNNSGTVSVINGSTNAVSSVTVGSFPYAVAVNPVTNTIYVANQSGNTVSVINGTTNAVTATVMVGSSPQSLAVNPVTNTIYVANSASNTVSVINGTTNAVSSVMVESTPLRVAVNPVTNTIYVANYGSGTVSVINGSTNAVSSVTAGTYPYAVAVNPVTNTIYVANYISKTVSVINGSTNALTATVTVGSFPGALAVNPVTNTIYVANTGGTTVSVINGATNAVSSVTVGSAPQSVAVNPATNTIYVSDPTSNTVSVINGSTNAVSSVTVGSSPQAVAVNPVTNTIYVADYSTGKVSVISGSTNTVSSVPVGAAPHAAAVNPATNTIYVANQGSNTVSVISGSTNAATGTVRVGSTPQAMAVNPVTNTIYVANYSSGTVSVINGSTNAVTASVTVGSRPFAVAVNAVTNTIYVPNYSSGTVSVINGSTNAVTATVTVGSDPGAVAVNPMTNTIYVANFGGTTVSVINGATNAVSSVTVGSAPQAVAVNQVTNMIYVANGNGTTVSVINGSTNALTATVTVGSYPQAVAVNPVTNTIYVANDNTSGTVSVIKGSTNAVTATVAVGGFPIAVSVNAVTNTIYVANNGGTTVSVINGSTNAVSGVTVGSYPQAVAVNPVTNNVYVPNQGGVTLSVIMPSTINTIPLTTAISGVSDGQTVSTTNVFETRNPTPSFSTTVTSAYTGTTAYSGVSGAANPAPTAVYYAVDGSNAWTYASPSTSGNPATFTFALPATQAGPHVLYLYAAYGNEGVLSNAGGSSPELGNVTLFNFQVDGPAVTLTGSPASQSVGSNVTLTAVLSPSAATGTVSFYDTFSGSAVLIGTATVSGGTASYNTSFSYGSHALIAAYSGDSTYGASSGTFTENIVGTTAQTISFPQPPSPVVYSAGLTATLTASASSGLTVTYTVVSGPATVSGSTLTYTGPGTVVVEADQAGNATYAAAPAVQQTVNVQATQTITFPQPASPVVYSAGLTATLTATASSGLTVTYTVISGPATVSGSTLTYTGPGMVVVEADQAGNASYAAAPAVQQTINVQTAQTITFPQPPTPVIYSAGLTATLTATASSGLTVTYTVISGPATVSGSTLTYTGPGMVVVEADQAGNTTYAAAPAVQKTVDVQTAQTITFPQPATPVVYSAGLTATLTATASSGLAVTYTVISGPATVSGSTLTYTGPGMVVVEADQAGNTTYGAAPAVQKTINVQTAQTITFPQPTSPVVYSAGLTATLTATASSGLAVTYTVVSGPATVSGSTLTYTGAGTVVVEADQAGNASYGAAPAVQRMVTVQPAAQTITFPQPANVLYTNGVTDTLMATSSSGLTVTYTVVSGPATVSGSTLTFTGPGAVVVEADQAGNATYAAAPAVQRTVYSQTATTLTLAASPTSSSYGAIVTLTATVSNSAATGTVVFSSNGITLGTGTVSSGVATLTSTGLPIGTDSVVATYSGDAGDAAATSNTVVVTVAVATTAVGSTSATQQVQFNFTSTVTLNATLATAIQVVTQGAANKDFEYVTGGSCAAGATYTNGQSCTVNFSFTPAVPGLRLGAVELYDNSATPVMVATALVGGAGTGPLAVTNSNPTFVAFATVPGKPTEAAFDGAGNLWVNDNNPGAGKVHKVTPSGVVTDYTYTGVNGPYAIAIDGAGFLYISQYSGGTVLRVDPVSLTSTVYASGFMQPEGLVFDQAGNLYVADTKANLIYKVTAANTMSVYVTASSTTNPDQLAIDTSGTLYWTSFSNNLLEKATTSNLTPTLVTSTLTQPFEVQVDAAKHIYVENESGTTTAVTEYTNAGTQIGSFGIGSALYGFALDASDNVFVVAYTTNTVYKATRTKGAPLAFANTAVGAASAAQNTEFENDGNAALTIASIAPSNSNFTFAGAVNGSLAACGSTLALAAQCNVAATFTPQSAGADTATGTVTDNSLNASGSTQTVALSGTGTAGTKTITFPQPTTPVTAGTSATLTASTSDGDPVTFSITAGTATISGTTTTGGVTTATIVYTNSGTVTIAANSAATANAGAATAVSRTVTVNAAPTSFTAPTEPVGTTSATQTAEVTFTTAGTPGTLDNSRVLTLGVANSDYKFVSGGTCSTSTAYTVGQSCTVLYSFTPSTAGLRRGAITLTNGSNAVLGTTYVSGTGTGPQALISQASIGRTISTNGSTRGISLDGAGNLYFATHQGGVYRVAAGTSTATQIATSINSADATVIDGAGNLYVASQGNGTLYFIAGATATPVAITAPRTDFDLNLEADGAGNIYGSFQAGIIYKITAGTHAYSALYTDGSGKRFVGIGIDAAGNLYPADDNGGGIYELPVGASTLTTLNNGSSLLANPTAVTLDAAGNLYIGFDTSTSTTNLVYRLAAGTYASTPLSGVRARYSIGLDGKGSLYGDNSNEFAEYIRTAGSPLTFANTAVGATSASQSVTLENDGNATLSIASITPPNGSFTIGTPAPSTGSTASSLLTAGTLSIPITFTPQNATAYSNVNAIVTDNSLNASGSTQTVPLSGTGTQGTKTITFVQPGTPANLNSTATLTASTSDGDAVVFTITAGTATISGTATTGGVTTATITYTTAGTVTIAANSPTTVNATAAAQVTRTVTVQAFPYVFVTNGGGSLTSLSTTGAVTSGPVTGGGIGAAIDASGDLWSIKTGGTSVSEFNSLGALSNTYSGAGISGATALAIDGKGVVWIADNGSISALTNAGVAVSTTGFATAGNISTPASISVDAAGSLWLANSGNGTVTEVIGVAAPVATPTVVQVVNGTPGMLP